MGVKNQAKNGVHFGAKVLEWPNSFSYFLFKQTFLSVCDSIQNHGALTYFDS